MTDCHSFENQHRNEIIFTDELLASPSRKPLAHQNLFAQLGNDTITYGYDALGRITSRAINDVGQSAGYDALGRVTVWTNALGSFTNVYVGRRA